MSKTPPLREWQLKAKEKIEQEWKMPGAKPLVAACPGAGKTLFSVTMARDALLDGRVRVVLVVSPTVNIKAQWVEQFADFNIDAVGEATNEMFRRRRVDGDHLTGGWSVVCLTYAQLAQDHQLFAEIARRYPTLLIADEIHHADDSRAYGEAIAAVAEEAKLRLALSGTPFNSCGGALAMCDSAEELNDEGRLVRKSLVTYPWSYGDAITVGDCRPVEFIKVMGRGTATYRSLTDSSVFQTLIDLAKENKNDSIGTLLDTDGEFMQQMCKEGLKALADVKRHDPRAGLLVVARNKEHGARLCRLIESYCKLNEEWRAYDTCEIYNDTPKAHERIKQLQNDRTDIVVTVRMISEGVDVKRLRVGLYATDYLTRMFFVQFVGRFIRWESRLDDSQHARVVIPGHIELLAFAREIEQMIDQALIAESGDDPGGDRDKKNEFLGAQSEVTGDGVIFRGAEESERVLAAQIFEMFPSARGKLPEVLAIQMAKDINLDGAFHAKQENIKEDWSRKNDQLVSAIKRQLKKNGESDQEMFAKINDRANRAVGIVRKDKLTSTEILQKRHAFLHSWLRAIRRGDAFEEAA